jgi:hypothetical protein
MRKPIALCACLAVICAAPVIAQQQPVTLKSAIVALVDDPAVRVDVEKSLVEKGRAHNYDAVTSYDIVPEVKRLDDAGFVRKLADQGIRAVLMLRPAAVGEGASLESVRDEVSPEVYRDMRAFAKEISDTDSDDLVAVVHMAVYTIRDGRADLVSAGAVWLDEEVANREEGIARLEDLIVRNLDEARPLIRQRLGLPPLPDA